MDQAIFWIGKILFSALFIFSGLNHFMQLAGTAQYAEAKGVPAPRIMVPATGLMLLLGGLGILLWGVIPPFWVAIACWLLIFFLLAAAFMVHDFWALDDPGEQQAQMAHFMKNTALAGAALIFYLLAAFEYLPPNGGA